MKIENVYVVSKRGRRPDGYTNLRAFANEVQAAVYCRNYLLDRSTLEDRQNGDIEMSECGRSTFYSFYTNEYGLIELKFEKIPYVDPFQDC